MKQPESIKNKIIKRFLVSTLIVATLLTLIASVSLNLYTNYAFKQDAENMAAFIRTDVLDGVELSSLSVDADRKAYDTVYAIFDDLCESFDLYYLYIFSLDQDGMVVRNIISENRSNVSGTDLEKLIGTKRAPTDYEKIILSGKKTQTDWQENNQYGKVRSYRFGIYRKDGSLAGFLGIDYPESDIKDIVQIGTVATIVTLTLVLFLNFILEYRLLNKNVFQPIGTISAMMRHMIADQQNTNRLPELQTSAEIQSIVTSFEKMSVDIQNYLQEVEMLTKEQAKTEAGMETARKIQMGFVPQSFAYHTAAICADATVVPAKAVGGDFYDCFVKENMLYGVVGDVSEKGISAALFMVVLKTKLSDCLKAGLSPAEALLTVNDDISGQNPEGMFATVFAFRLDLKTGEMTFANAGHTRPIVLSDEVRYLDMHTGMLLGLMKEIPIRNETLQLRPGDAMLIYTDGVTEAVDGNRKLYGEERLLSLLQSTAVNGAAELTDTVKASVDAYQQGCEQYDDITVFSVKYYGETALTLPCAVSAMEKIRAAVFDRFGKTPQARTILLACEEMFANICDYAQADAVHVRFTDEDGCFVVTMQDNGVPFDPTGYDKKKPFEQLAGGGMGISMVKQLTEAMTYTRADGSNVLKLYFNI